MITGKYSALKGFSLLILVAVMVLDLIFTVEGPSPVTRWGNLIVAECFGIGLIQYLWSRWKDK